MDLADTNEGGVGVDETWVRQLEGITAREGSSERPLMEGEPNIVSDVV